MSGCRAIRPGSVAEGNSGVISVVGGWQPDRYRPFEGARVLEFNGQRQSVEWVERCWVGVMFLRYSPPSVSGSGLVS